MASTLIQDGINAINTQAINAVIEGISSIDITPLLIYYIEYVDSSALPHLATQFHVLGYEGWDFATTDSQKRELIKNAIQMHRYKGTLYSLKIAINMLFSNVATITEWFQYNGKPYCFKVNVDISNTGISEQQYTDLLNLIFEWKNTRSWLDSLDMVITNTDSLFIGANVFEGQQATLYPQRILSLENGLSLTTGAILSTGYEVFIYPKPYCDMVFTGAFCLYGNATTVYPEEE